MKAIRCAGCDQPILDKYLANMEGRDWHSSCLTCSDCHRVLSERCYSRNDKFYCQQDFYRRFATRCGGCAEVLLPNDMVRRARGIAYHVACFRCLACGRQILTGERLRSLPGDAFICERHVAGADPSAPLQEETAQACPACPDDEDEPAPFDDSDPPPPSATPTEGVSGGSGADSRPPSAEGAPSTEGGALRGDEGPGGKRRGPRTTIKAKQLETLKAAFSATPKPTRLVREQLAQETGLNMRVIQVWFQNRRSKERRMKQLTAMGTRRHFFRGPRRALRRGEESVSLPHPPFAYYSDSSSPNEFGFGPVPGFYDCYSQRMDMGGALAEHPPDFPGTVPLMPHHPHVNNGLGPDGQFVGHASDCLGGSPPLHLAEGNFSAPQEGATFPYMPPRGTDNGPIW